MQISASTRATGKSLRPTRFILCCNYNQARTFVQSSVLRDESASSEEGAFKKGKPAKVDPQAVEGWFRGEGLPYLNPTPGKPNWLGGNIPYPDNPTFKPPPPLSDVVKTSIYDRYLKSPQLAASNSESHNQTVRTLSEQFGVSIARIEAIVRLKNYERQYQKVTVHISSAIHKTSVVTFSSLPDPLLPDYELCIFDTDGIYFQDGKKLQHAFQRGMESYLGVHPEIDRAIVSDSRVDPLEINVTRQRTADVDNEISGTANRDQQRGGAARRVWWEMVEDAPDSQPVVPGIVAKGLESYRNKLSEDQKAHAGISLHVDGPNPPAGKPRTVFTFVDTGARGPAKKARA
ncbi:Eukaryotic mitochondrial regulator protein, partial [Rhizoctonia solani]